MCLLMQILSIHIDTGNIYDYCSSVVFPSMAQLYVTLGSYLIVYIRTIILHNHLRICSLLQLINLPTTHTVYYGNSTQYPTFRLFSQMEIEYDFTKYTSYVTVIKWKHIQLIMLKKIITVMP